MSATVQDLQAVALTVQLAACTTALLLVLATPLAWWLSRAQSGWRNVVGAVVALPLVLPPTVLGFYLLLAMGPDGPLGRFTHWLGVGSLSFTFSGLVIGSLVYSLPFAVQPLLRAFENIGPRPLEVAATLQMSPWQAFRSVVLPLARPGYAAAGVLTFAHTLGEFGVVLMIGGNIPGATQVVSTLIYGHVEAMDYGRAHALSLGMLLFSFVMVLTLGWVMRRPTPAPP